MAAKQEICPVCLQPIPVGHLACPVCAPLTARELRDFGDSEGVMVSLSPLPPEEQKRLRRRWARMMHQGEGKSTDQSASSTPPIPSPPALSESQLPVEPPQMAAELAEQPDIPATPELPEGIPDEFSVDGESKTPPRRDTPQPIATPQLPTASSISLADRYAVERHEPIPPGPEQALEPGELEGLHIMRGQAALLQGEYQLSEPLLVEAGGALHLNQAVLRFGPGATLHCRGFLQARSVRFLAQPGGRSQVILEARSNANLEGCIWQHLNGSSTPNRHDQPLAEPSLTITGSARARLQQCDLRQPLAYSPALLVRGTGQLLMETCQAASGQLLLICRDRGKVEMHSSKLRQAGSLIYARGEGTALLVDCCLEQCGGTKVSPLVAQDSSHLVLEKCDFFDCTGKFGGAAVAMTTATVTCNNCLFFACRAEFGGALAASGQGKLETDSATFVECRAEKRGGALAAGRDSIITVRHSSFNQCQASEGGGVFCLGLGGLSHCTFQECQAETRGGAVYGKGHLNPQVSNCQAHGCHPKPDFFYA